MYKNAYPEMLKSLPIWILWNLEKHGNDKATKVLKSANYKGNAKTNDNRTWASYSKVLKVFNESGNTYSGIGICLSKEYKLIFIDIDHCINEYGELDSRANEILPMFKNQYVEISQSGTGIHIICLGEIPYNFKNTKANIEMYSEKRFVALTGNAIYNCEPKLCQEELNKVFEKYSRKKDLKNRAEHRAVKSLDKTSSWIIEHARKNYRNFESLFNGDWESCGYPSQSEADFSLCCMLAFWCDCNFDLINNIFCQSGLYRDKWDREDYRTNTINEAISRCSKTISEYIREKQEMENKEIERACIENWS